jgi:1-acyl-sn-glycerol-3-phosphate acyltransferase
MKAKRFCRILVFTISMFLVTHIIVFFYLFPICTLRLLFNPEKGTHIKKSITGLLFAIIGKRLNVTGVENINAAKKYVIVSNYPGSYAGFALMNCFPGASIMVHSFFIRVPIVGFLLKATGAVFVQQKTYGQTRRAIDETLKQAENKSIIILPEGGRSPDGAIRRFRQGFVYILRHSSRDLLPVTLNGFYGLKPLKRPYLDPDVNLEIVIHKPIEQAVINNINNENIVKLTVDIIQAAYRP